MAELKKTVELELNFPDGMRSNGDTIYMKRIFPNFNPQLDPAVMMKLGREYADLSWASGPLARIETYVEVTE